MCYNYSYLERRQRKNAERERKISPLVAELVRPPVYAANGFSFPYMPIVTAEEPDLVQPYRWGLIPWFTKADSLSIIKARTSTLNCRSESMFDKPSFKQSAVGGKRCLILATGFFEYHTLNPKLKIPFYFERKDQEEFCFAGIYNEYINKDTGEIFNNYSMLTCKASTLLAKIHNAREEEDFRMPVILKSEYEEDWLNPSLTKDDVLALCQPYDDSLLNFHPVSKRLTSRKDNPNVPEAQEYYHWKELDGIF